MNSKRKSGVLIRIAVVLLCAVLFAGVASIGGISVTKPQATTADGGEYQFTVTNGSDVAVAYDILVSFEAPDDTDDIDVTKLIDPDSVKLDGVAGTVSDDYDGNVFEFVNVGMLQPSGTSSATITFDVNAPVVNVDSSFSTLTAYSGSFPFTVSVRATQIN